MAKLHENISLDAIGAGRRHQDETELLRDRVALLAGRDKALMTMYMVKGISIRQIARLLGTTESRIARRIRKLTTNLIDGEYLECLRTREKFTRNQLDIARDYFLSGHSIRMIAARRRRSIYSIRKIVRDVHEQVQQGKLTVTKVPKMN